MSDPGYPDDIHQYDNDPRSPFYDAGPQEAWTENRYCELLEDISEIDCLDFDAIGEIVLEHYRHNSVDGRQTDMVTALVDYVEKKADEQAEKDYLSFADSL